MLSNSRNSFEAGCWAWGDKTGVWGYGGYDKSLSDETIAEAFKASIDKGVNFFDTAEASRPLPSRVARALF